MINSGIPTVAAMDPQPGQALLLLRMKFAALNPVEAFLAQTLSVREDP